MRKFIAKAFVFLFVWFFLQFAFIAFAALCFPESDIMILLAFSLPVLISYFLTKKFFEKQKNQAKNDIEDEIKLLTEEIENKKSALDQISREEEKARERLTTIKSEILMKSAQLEEEELKLKSLNIDLNEHQLLKVDNFTGYEFEEWCADLLRANDFNNVKITAGSGDHGVDIIAHKNEIKYAIQCKCYHSDLSNKPVQEIYAGKEMYGCHIGVVMTNRGFTDGAKKLAEKTNVLLWDRSKIKEML